MNGYIIQYSPGIYCKYVNFGFTRKEAIMNFVLWYITESGDYSFKKASSHFNRVSSSYKRDFEELDIEEVNEFYPYNFGLVCNKSSYKEALIYLSVNHFYEELIDLISDIEEGEFQITKYDSKISSEEEFLAQLLAMS